MSIRAEVESVCNRETNMNRAEFQRVSTIDRASASESVEHLPSRQVGVQRVVSKVRVRSQVLHAQYAFGILHRWPIILCNIDCNYYV